MQSNCLKKVFVIIEIFSIVVNLLLPLMVLTPVYAQEVSFVPEATLEASSSSTTNPTSVITPIPTPTLIPTPTPTPPLIPLPNATDSAQIISDEISHFGSEEPVSTPSATPVPTPASLSQSAVSASINSIPPASSICSTAERIVRYHVSAINVVIPINGWGEANPMGMMYALNNSEALPNATQIKDRSFKLYDTTDQSVPQKIQPLVLRANIGDCIEVILKNELDTSYSSIDPVTLEPIGPRDNKRNIGMQISGLPYDPLTSDGAFIGNNPDTTVAPGQERVYRWFADKIGGFMFRDISNAQWPQDTITKGLFGMLIVEPRHSTWRDSISGRNFLKANPQNSFEYQNLSSIGTDELNRNIYLGVGASIFADIHQKAGMPLPKGAMLLESVSGNDYRDFALIMHDEFEGLVSPIFYKEDGTIAAYGKPFSQMTGVENSTLLFNYRSEPMRNRDNALARHRGMIPLPEKFDPQTGVKISGGMIDGTKQNPFTSPILGVPYVDIPLPDGTKLTVNASEMTVILPNGKKFGPNDSFCEKGIFKPDNAKEGDPSYQFYQCEGEEASLPSWIFGDPAVALPRAYWGDPVIFYVASADAHDTHTFHQHTHRWFRNPDQADTQNLPLPDNPLQKSNRLDVQSIGAGEVVRLVYEQGAGSVTGTAGDAIFHCHLYPHFADGVWGLFRVFDKLRINFSDSSNIQATLQDGTLLTYPDGTHLAVLQPLPSRMDLHDTSKLDSPDNRFQAPIGMANREPDIPTKDRPGFPLFVAGKFGLKPLQPPLSIINPQTGVPIKDRAIPTQLEKDASYDGIRPGAMLVDPCKGPNAEFVSSGNPSLKPDRLYQPHAIQVPFIQNKKGGFFNPEQRAYVERELVDAVRRDPSKLEPYSFRGNVGDCVEVHTTNNLQPNDDTPTLGSNDKIYHDGIFTSEISQHVHHVRFDEMGSPGTSVGWNYDHSARSGETIVSRWFIDVNVRTVFTHDHQYPTSHQQNGLYAALIVEPKNAFYKNSTNGNFLGPLTSEYAVNMSSKRYDTQSLKGVGVAASIELSSTTTQDTSTGILGGAFVSFREFVVQYSDFTPSFIADPNILKEAFETLKENPDSFAPFDPILRKKPFFPPPLPNDYAVDQGISTINYRVEPFQSRVNPDNPNSSAFINDPAYIFSSVIHGDPETAVFRAYSGDPVIIRLMDGAHEEHHTFTIQGHRWLEQPANPQSNIISSQAFNIAEYFNFELMSNNKNELGAGSSGDYLFGSLPTTDLWSGMWGIFRVENGLKADLYPLPGRPQPQEIPDLGLLPQEKNQTQGVPKINEELMTQNNPCPAGSPKKKFDILAIQKSITYNALLNQTDPFGLLYVLAKDKQAVLNGNKETEPLIIRANEGDCIEITLTNELPDLTSLAQETPVILPSGIELVSSLDPKTLQHIGDAQMPAAVEGFPTPQTSYAKFPMSNRISMYNNLLQSIASAGSGSTVGFMRDQTVGPGERIMYMWYADREAGITLLDDYGDIRSHRHHGLFAALIVEPKNSLYLDVYDPILSQNPLKARRIESGATAVIYNSKTGKWFREFVTLFSDGLNIRQSNQIIPDSGLPLVKDIPPGPQIPEEGIRINPCSPPEAECEDPEQQGEAAINYKTARLSDRAPLVIKDGHTSEIDFNSDAFKVLSSLVHGDPSTPVFESFVGDDVVMRIGRPSDLQTVLSLGITGHNWLHEQNDINSMIFDTAGTLGVGDARNLYLMDGAGSFQKAAGDYMYFSKNHVESNLSLPGGQWGLLRVFGKGSPSKIIPLALGFDPSKTAPELTLKGLSVVEILLNTPYNDAGATAYDDIDGDISDKIKTIGLPIDTSKLGEYVITYAVENSLGNLSIVQRIIKVFIPQAEGKKETVAPDACADSKPKGAPVLSVASVGDSEVTLSWQKAEGSVSYYLLAFGLSSQEIAYGNPNIGGKDTTSYTVKGLASGTAYYFKIRAGNGCMPGDYSNEVKATTLETQLISGDFATREEGVLGTVTNQEEETGEKTVSQKDKDILDEKTVKHDTFTNQVKGLFGNALFWTALGVIVIVIAVILFKL